MLKHSFMKVAPCCEFVLTDTLAHLGSLPTYCRSSHKVYFIDHSCIQWGA